MLCRLRSAALLPLPLVPCRHAPPPLHRPARHGGLAQLLLQPAPAPPRQIGAAPGLVNNAESKYVICIKSLFCLSLAKTIKIWSICISFTLFPCCMNINDKVAAFNAKMWARILVNIVLLTVYGYFFGRLSVLKYMDKGVIVIKQEETPSYVPPPGLALQ